MPYQPGDQVRHRQAMVVSTILSLHQDYPDEGYGIYLYTTEQYGSEEFLDDFEYASFELINRTEVPVVKKRYKEREYVT